MAESILQGGTLQVVHPTPQQIVYLDFDGELTRYNGELLTIDNVEVQHSLLTSGRIENILALLNEKYAFQNVKFVTELPASGEYSTVYVGKTDAFSAYGDFAGLAETIDYGNWNKDDKAFVMLDSSASDAMIVSTIAHETDHLLGTLDHGGNGLAQYACDNYNNVLTGAFNGKGYSYSIYDVWFTDHSTGSRYLAGQEYHTNLCSSITYHYNRINNAVLTNGRFGINAGYSITSTTIGSGAHVSLASPVLYNSGTASAYTKYPHADTIKITSGGVLNVFVTSATNITIQSSGGIAHANTGSLLTHHGEKDAFITDFSSGAKVSGRIDNFNFNGDLYTYGAVLNSVTLGREPTPNGGYYYGYLHMYDNSVANNTTVSGGVIYVNSGNSALNTTVSAGTLSAYNGAVIDTLTMTGGSAYFEPLSVIKGTTIVSGGELTIHSNKTFTTPLTVLNSGVVSLSATTLTGARVSSGGLLQGYGVNKTVNTVILNGGTQTVNYQSEADGTIVSSGGSMYLYGIASNTTVDNGYFCVSASYASAYDTVLRGSTIQYQEYGDTFRTHISSGAIQSVGFGAEAYDAIVSSGGSQVIHGAGNYKALASNTTVYGVQSAVSNATLSKTFVYGSQYLGSNVSANENHIVGGKLTAVSGAYINNLYVSSGGTALLDSAVSAVSGTILSGCVVSNGNFANVTISSGGLLKDGTPTAYYGGVLTLKAGGSATGIILDQRDQLHVTVANDTLLQANCNGSAYNISNGIFENLAIYSSSTIDITAGAIARNVTVQSSGTLNIAGSAQDITNAYAGSMSVISGGHATNVTNSGYLYVYDGGVLEKSQNNGFYGAIYVSNGGVVKDTNINSNGIHIYSGGKANNTIVNSYGKLYASDGGMANGTTVKNYGSMYISSGGKHCGALQLEGHAFVSAYSGAIIDFTVADRTSADNYLINNLALVKGAPTYTITVSANQEDGTYKLAQGAAKLTGSITICNQTTCFGELTINGEALTYNNVTYQLNNADGVLTLTVSNGSPAQTTVFAFGKFNGCGGMFELTTNGTGYIRTAYEKQQITGTLDSEKWELAGVADFNGCNTEGLLWIEKDTGYVYVQNDLTNFNEVNNKTNCLGVVGEGYSILAAGDFTGTGINGVLMQGPAFGDASVSLNYGLPIWGREADGTTFAGWLGALVNTWQPGDALKGNTSDLADINAKNYMYEVVSVGDYNGDGVDDVMLQNIMPKMVNGVTITGSGDVFTFLTGDMNAIKAGAAPTVAYAGCATGGWDIMGSGDFNGDGIDDVLLSDGTGVAGWQMAYGQQAGNQWFGNLGDTEEIAGIADLNNDGTDDIVVLNTATETYYGWLVKNGSITGAVTIA